MLAEKYQNDYAWNTERITVQEKHLKKKAAGFKRIRQQVLLLGACFLVLYLLSVVRSEVLFTGTGNLLTLKQQENLLVSSNAELRIEVEQLKSPERISGIAQNVMGMQVARNNIYVQASGQKTAYDGYAYAR